MAERRGSGLQILPHGFKSRSDLHHLNQKLREDKQMSELEKSERPWGRYEVLQESDTHKVKCIWMNPGARLSYQRHKFRAEHWFIVQGTGIVTIDGVESKVGPGDTVEFEIGVLHRLANTGADEIIFVEVQTGTSFGEDDIERVEDDFGRAGK
jgi:mannose-6-phosphate isomerase